MYPEHAYEMVDNSCWPRSPSVVHCCAGPGGRNQRFGVQSYHSFSEDPTSNLGHAARAVIVSFSHDSPDVIIRFTPKNYPISEIKPASEEERLTLLAAFVAGNLDSQLVRGLKKDDAYAGDLQLIQTYRQLQKRNPRLRILAVEKLAELESRGQLKEYLASK